MSTLVENVQKVVAAHKAIGDAISSNGVTIPEGTKLTDMPALIDQIEKAPPAPTNPRAVFTYDGVTSIVVPSMLVVDMTKITNLVYCFYNCSSLTSLTLPEAFGRNTTSLASCFCGCSSLTSLTLPSGFGQNAQNALRCFYNCSSLTSLTLPSGFGRNTTNMSSCFYYCSSLMSLTLPSDFGQNATVLTSLFYGCSQLINIYGNPNFKVSLNLSDCTQLTHDSLMVVINGLQTVTTSQILTLGTTNLAKLTDEEKAIATSKGWALA